jgi:aerobic C4-dicarboxylate transport protein
MSQCRALPNIDGNGVGTLVIARWEGDLDRARLKAELDRGPGPDPEALLEAPLPAG